ncbi:AAA family ATPase [Thalassotalea aquiviva]|uniref:AAA family ATPase n=1 Tax=Thalassotalea aquiviva TaxID=3242415 RepID=UPI00352B89F9
MFNHPRLQEHLNVIRQIHHSSLASKYSLLIIGESGVGKTFLAKHYFEQNPPIELSDRAIFPVLYCKLVQTKTASDLLQQLIIALGAIPNKVNSKAYLIQERLIHLLREHRVELIIIDEVQECLPDIDGIMAQRMAKQFAALIDCSKIPMILLGTPMSSRLLALKYGTKDNLVYGEEQLSRRFIAERMIEPIPQRCQAWLDCINYFCGKYIFKTFSLDDKQLLNRVYIATKGKIGLVNKLFSFLRADKTTIDLTDLYDSFRLSINSKSINPFDVQQLSNTEVTDLLDSWKNKT